MKEVSLIYSPQTTEAKIRKIERLHQAVQTYRALQRLAEVSNQPLSKNLQQELEYLTFIINYAV